MIMGLTGKNAAGKGELATHLKNKGFVYFSLSDALRDEATKQGLDHSRNVLIKLGTEMREKFGNGILAKRINEKISKLQNKDIVVDSIRNPGEIEELRKNKGFILVAVHTDAKIRFERLVKRGRVGDAQTLEEFLEHEKKENNNEGAGQQLDKCIEMADKIIDSNGTVEEANKDLDSYLDSLKDYHSTNQ
ncbi:MAG: AAA family ATPase [Nanoarchaeota archaeon]|nr:AAA family ATPase [Nanoarchaeota archaeon]